VLGVFHGKKLVVNWRISTNRQNTADEYGILIKDLFNYARINSHEIKAVVISSVVPPLMASLSQMSTKYFGVEPLIVGPGVRTGISIKYEDPREVGADRIVNTVAALKLYGGPVIIVDFGTAITFCAISGNGEYLGGAITPGIGIATEALFRQAAKLPRIELVKPKNVIGRNTVVSMQAGIVYGYVGLIDEIVGRMKVEMDEGDPVVVATGGFAEMIGSETKTITEINPFLTLEGLRIIYELNQR
jgi:type III pantothenate kinase